MNRSQKSVGRRVGLILAAGMFALPTSGAAAAPGIGMASDEAACATPSEVATGPPSWGQAYVDGRRVWPISNGQDVPVAVISSGVDAANGQFPPGSVEPGLDLLAGPGASQPADNDCDGRGTFVAGLIAARPTRQTSFVGLAPGARILPVRVVQQVSDGQQASEVGGRPDQLARAIAWSVRQGARVICVTVSTDQDSKALQDAVQDATSSGALVVAGGAPAGDAEDSPTRYPAAYPDVLAVGAVAEDGSPVPGSDLGPYVDIVAPGGGLVSTSAVDGRAAIGHTAPQDDPAAATALVAGAAALVMAYRPQLDARDVALRLVGTAYAVTGPHPTGSPHASDAVPALFVAAAVAEHLVGTSRPIDLTLATPVADPALLSPTDRRALSVTWGVLVLVALATTTAVTVGRGKARGGRRAPGRPS